MFPQPSVFDHEFDRLLPTSSVPDQPASSLSRILPQPSVLDHEFRLFPPVCSPAQLCGFSHMPVLHLGPHPTRDSTIWPDMDPAHTAMERLIFFEHADYLDALVSDLEGGEEEVKTLETIAETEAWLQDRPWLCHSYPYLEETRERLRKWHSTASPSESPFWGTRQARGGPRSLQRNSGGGLQWGEEDAHTPTARTPAPPGAPIRNPPRERPRGPSGTPQPQVGPSGGVRTMERGRPQRESLSTEAGSQAPAPSSGGVTSDPCSKSEVPA